MKIQEIKSDIRNGYNWTEYEGKYGEWNYTIQYTTHGQYVNGDILIYFENDTHYASALIPAEEFISMKKADFEKKCNEILYYDCIEKE